MAKDLTESHKEIADRATEMLAGKSVAKVISHRPAELLIEFEDGTRLYIDANADRSLDLSITGGSIPQCD